MKKIIITTLAGLLMLSAYAGNRHGYKKKKKGSEAFSMGQVTCHIGLGLLTTARYDKMGYGFYGANDIKKKPGFSVMADYAVNDMLSMGLACNFSGGDVTITDNTNPDNIYGFKNKFKMFGLKSSYHQKLGSDKIDPYAGLTLGFNSCKADAFGDLNYLDPYKGGLAWALQAGANYYFTKNIGAHLELGYGRWIPALSFGLAAKI